MAYVVKQNTKLFVNKEVTEGTYVAPSAATDAIEASDAGVEIKASKEQLELKVVGMGLSRKASRSGLKSVSTSFSSYMKAGATAAGVCESDLLLESAFGSKRNKAATTSGTGNTSTVIKIASTTGFAVGDSVLIKEAGAYHVSPIASIQTNVSITLLIACPGGAPADNVVVEAFTSYVLTNDSHSSLSISKYLEDAILETSFGNKVTSFSVDSFETGKNAMFKFGLEGVDFSRSLAAPGYTPSYDASNTPVILNACLYQDGIEVAINNFSLTLENKLGFITDTCDGKKASRVTERTIKGSINPFKDTASIAQFTKWNADTVFSLFISASNPTGTTGQIKEVVSFYLPQVKITELGEADQDGVVQDTISFEAVSDGTLKELYISIS